METIASIAVAISLIPAIGLCCVVFVRWIYPMRIEFEDDDEGPVPYNLMEQ